ncbi:outer membrane protein assembly factor BamB family protein [Neolewinella persica]|uniref:outer membrane protein assembly factor BamB family protein n=1 Tax=Neolewinella persica TaxID=70998 RepID=UPI0003766D1B|nr:PQQ-binding-like beta-propeller repeat protein [Neolewinella persica]
MTTTQAQTDWKKWYGEPNQQEILIAAEPGADSTNFWAAGTIANGFHDDFWLVRFNPQGEIIWSDTLGNPDRNERLSDFSRNTTTGEMWLAGDSRPGSDWKNRQVFLQKLDANGQLIFERTGLFGFIGNGEIHLNIKAVGNGVLIFHQETGILRRLDALGEVVWERTFSTSANPVNRQNVEALPDGGCFFIENLNNPDRCVLYRLDAEGQTNWQTTLEFPTDLTSGSHGTSLAVDAADTSVYVAARSGSYDGMQKFAADGQLVWETVLPFPAVQNGFLDSWLLQIPANNQIALFSNHAYQVLDNQTGAFITGEDNFSPSQSSQFVLLNDGVLFPDGTFTVVGTTSENWYSYDGYSAQRSADDFQILQENTFGSPSPNDTDYLAWVETAADGDSYLANITYFEGRKTGIVLRKISPDGAEIWKKAFTGTRGYWNLEMRSADDGNLFLMGHSSDSISVKKLNPDGDLLWQRDFRCIGNIATQSLSAPLQNGGVVVFSPFATFRPIVRYWEVRGFAADGNEMWKRRIFEDQINDSGLQWRPLSTVDLGDGTVAAVGRKDATEGLLVRLDLLTGAPVFEKIISDSGSLTDVLPSSDGGFLALRAKYVGDGLDEFELYKISEQGAILAVQNLPLTPKDYSIHSGLYRDAEGNVVLSALSDDNLLEVLKLNDNLDLLDQKTISLQPNMDRISGQRMLPDGSLLLTGQGPNANSADVFIIKTDKSGIVSNRFLLDESDFRIFPNPVAAGQPLHIVLENDFRGTVKFEILSMDGRVISVFKAEKTDRNQVFKTLNLPVRGSFLVRFSDKERSAVRLVFKF